MCPVQISTSRWAGRPRPAPAKKIHPNLFLRDLDKLQISDFKPQNRPKIPLEQNKSRKCGLPATPSVFRGSFRGGVRAQARISELFPGSSLIASRQIWSCVRLQARIPGHIIHFVHFKKIISPSKLQFAKFDKNL